MLRQINLSAIMDHIRVEAPISRSLLAMKTGLNKATVTSLVGELIQRNFIIEIGLETKHLGRPSMQLMLNPQAGFIIGSEIGVDFVNVIGTDFSPKIIFQAIEKINPNMPVDEVMRILISNIKKARELCASQVGENFLGLALGVPGLVDSNTGELLFAPNLNWKCVALREYLKAEFFVPIIIDNEANLATLGEYFFGAAYQHPDVLYLSAGVGLGGGILRESRLFRGASGMAGEFGHITMDPMGEKCGCGNYGCWETQVSQWALFRYVAKAIGENRTSVLWQQTGYNLQNLTVPMVVTAARDGDQVARESLEKVGHYLGIGIASMVNALNPGIVVFGGTLSIAWEYLEPIIVSELNKRALISTRESTQIVLAQHGHNACVMGGIAVIYQAIIPQPSVG